MSVASAIVEQVSRRTDIRAVIGEHLRLVPSGDDWKGVCPFHPDDALSFHVSSRERFFYCFGCQRGGDVIQFLMDFENRGIWDVVRSLARDAQVDLDPSDAQGEVQGERHVT